MVWGFCRDFLNASRVPGDEKIELDKVSVFIYYKPCGLSEIHPAAEVDDEM